MGRRLSRHRPKDRDQGEKFTARALIVADDAAQANWPSLRASRDMRLVWLSLRHAFRRARMNPFESGTGIVVYRASRLEALLTPLETLLAQFPPQELLAPQIVLAAHPGIRRWLRQALARKRGTGGIVANLEVQLPSAWLDVQTRSLLGVSAVSLAPYRREALRWRLYELLPQSRQPEILAYLDGADATRRFQFADHLAALYTRYMVYRPDWLARWQRGDFAVPRANFIAPLWQKLRRDIGSAHRGELLLQLTQRLEAASTAETSEPLHVFGLSHLAPIELDVLRAQARHRLVVLYLPDPCVEFWAGIGNERTRLEQLLQLDTESENGDALERELLGLEHPLLAAWGRLGQHFGLSLNAGEGRVISETRHGLDHDAAMETDSVLHALQQSIRSQRPAFVDARLSPSKKNRNDVSLRVHGCHTRLRELEVLRDAMLDALRRDPGLHPSQMIVMSPNIGEYAALVPAVFGAPVAFNSTLPYHLADLPTRATHRVFDAFAALLALPLARISAPQVLDLLQVPAIARALSLDDGGIEQLRLWLGAARVVWGLDAGTREHFGLRGYFEHSFAWGMDRLLAGYVYGDDAIAAGTMDAAAAQVDSWPVAQVAGLNAAALGSLDRLLCECDAIARFATEPRPLSAWCEQLHGLVARLFRADAKDASEIDAISTVTRMIEAVRSSATAGAVDPVLPFALLRDLVQEQLDAVPERQAFLLGAATFCGMVPQRSIPFRFIAVLGLNDGEFPRAASGGGIDLMAITPRLGDRDVRNDDRYLFLETLMAAREQLHLSYLSESVRDGKPMNPAAPLAELLAFLEARATVADRDAKTPAQRPWLVRHALQPFDPRYFSADPQSPYYTYQPAFAVTPTNATPPVSRFVRRASATPSIELTQVPVALHSVLAYFKDPARSLLRAQLKLSLDALDVDGISDSEPLQAKLPKLERVPRALVLDALARGVFDVADEAATALRLSGSLPPGALAEIAYAEARDSARAILQSLQSDPLFAGGLRAASTLALDLEVGAVRLTGQLERVHRIAGQWVLLEVFPDKAESDFTFKERLPLFIEWALLLRLLPDADCALRVLCKGAKTPWLDRLRAMPRAALDHGLVQLLAFWSQAQSRPSWYFPATSWAIAKADPEKQRKSASDAWYWFDGTRGESVHAPGYAAWLARGAALFDERSEDWPELVANALHLAQAIGAERAS